MMDCGGSRQIIPRQDFSFKCFIILQNYSNIYHYVDAFCFLVILVPFPQRFKYIVVGLGPAKNGRHTARMAAAKSLGAFPSPARPEMAATRPGSPPQAPPGPKLASAKWPPHVRHMLATYVRNDRHMSATCPPQNHLPVLEGGLAHCKKIKNAPPPSPPYTNTLSGGILALCLKKHLVHHLSFAIHHSPFSIHDSTFITQNPPFGLGMYVFACFAWKGPPSAVLSISADATEWVLVIWIGNG